MLATLSPFESCWSEFVTIGCVFNVLFAVDPDWFALQCKIDFDTADEIMDHSGYISRVSRWRWLMTDE